MCCTDFVGERVGLLPGYPNDNNTLTFTSANAIYIIILLDI